MVGSFFLNTFHTLYCFRWVSKQFSRKSVFIPLSEHLKCSYPKFAPVLLDFKKEVLWKFALSYITNATTGHQIHKLTIAKRTLILIHLKLYWAFGSLIWHFKWLNLTEKLISRIKNVHAGELLSVVFCTMNG